MYIRKGPETFTQQIYYYYHLRVSEVSLLIKTFLDFSQQNSVAAVLF